MTKSLLEMVEESMNSKSLLELVEESLLKTTTSRTDAYDEFIKNNRAHQNQALDAISQASKGQVILPTGTGKTRVQVAMIVQDMRAKNSKGAFGVYAIASHRLLLNKQLMDELLDLCIKCNLPVNALYVGSSRQDDKEVYDKYFSNGIGNLRVGYTTVEEDIKTFAEQTIGDNRHLILVSTYHSFDRLKALNSVDICAYDEAHNTTEQDFQKKIRNVIEKINRNYFFTATRKVSTITGHGMEDESIYGNVLIEISPTKMIQASEILMPRVITFFLDDKELISTSNDHMLVKTVTEAFDKSKERVKADSSEPDLIGNKMIVSSEGSDELNKIQESQEFQEWCTKNKVRVFSFSSKYGFFVDFEKSDRDTVYKKMKELSDPEDAILLHIDILTEGMDLPSITSILLLRNLNEVRLFQTLGRGLRLTGRDRQGLYSGKITEDQFIKKYAYLILPMHFERMDTSGPDMKNTIQDVIGTYGIPTEAFLPTEVFRTKEVDDLDLVTKIQAKKSSGKDYPLLSVVEDFIIGEVKKEFPKDPKRQYDALMSMFKGLGGGNA